MNFDDKIKQALGKGKKKSLTGFNFNMGMPKMSTKKQSNVSDMFGMKKFNMPKMGMGSSLKMPTFGSKGASPRMQSIWKSMGPVQKSTARRYLKDTDGDRVPDRFDCQPRNPMRQDTSSELIDGDELGNYAYIIKNDNGIFNVYNLNNKIKVLSNVNDKTRSQVESITYSLYDDLENAVKNKNYNKVQQLLNQGVNINDGSSSEPQRVVEVAISNEDFKMIYIFINYMIKTKEGIDYVPFQEIQRNIIDEQNQPKKLEWYKLYTLVKRTVGKQYLKNKKPDVDGWVDDEVRLDRKVMAKMRDTTGAIRGT